MTQKHRVLKFSVFVLFLFSAIGLRVPATYATEPDRITVYRIQKKLKQLGYMSGLLSGHWENKTKRALKRFQQDNGLQVTGKVDDETKAKLGTSDEVINPSLSKQTTNPDYNGFWGA